MKLPSAIAKNSLMAYKYAVDVLKDRFPAGEPAIMNDQYIYQICINHTSIGLK